MMELNDSTAEHLLHLRGANTNRSPEPRSVPLGIDLNEIPSPPQAETLSADLDSVDVVRSFHYNLQPPPGPAVAVPGEGRTFVCGACGRPEVKGEVIVCDGCERGFHLNCTGMQESQQGIWEWVCVECSSTGVTSKRWPLGVKSKHILDINSSPPSDGEGTEDLLDFRKHTSGDNSFGGNPFGGPVTYSNFFYAGNAYGFQKASGIMTQGVTVAFHGIVHQAQAKSFEEVGYPFGKLRSNLGVMLPQQNPGEILQALRDFISERRGVLGDGWHVEFKQSIGSCGLYAIYCAPDGKTFDSMSEVACYLGLMSNCSSPSPAVGRSTSTLDRLHLPKRRKLTRFSDSNGSAENKEIIKVGYYEDPSSDGQIMGSCTSKLLNAVKPTEAGTQEKIVIESQQANDGFPLQFKDFFILSLGTVDERPSYHDVNLVWPVGYRSCWHDKMTGSLFLCEVLDGGDSGPVFKVWRHSCSTWFVPIGSTVLVPSNTIHCVDQSDDDTTFYRVHYDNDGSIQMMLVDPSPPLENEVLSCLGGSVSEPCTDEMPSSVQFEGSSGHDGSGNLLSSHDPSAKDVIGEISVEESSPALAWRSLSQKFISACSEICKQAGKLQFICQHTNSEMYPPYSYTMDKDKKASFSSVAKFCSSQCSVRIPSILQGDKELDSVFSDLEKWLNQDRFGLDAEFVQEIIEQLPGVSGCSQYKCLKERSTFPSSLTVGNGFLMVNRNGGHQSNKGCGLYGGGKKVKLAKDQRTDYPRSHPPGKPLGSRLPPQLVGDVYQVWELLLRFHEILGLNEPLSLEELEEELINPWSDRSNVVEKLRNGVQGNQSLNFHDVGGTNGQAVSTNPEFGTVASRGDPHELIQMDTGKMKETAQCRMTSFSYGGYSGKALTKAHNALLKVLIPELQSKVAALVDPTFDAGESKTKRGRKRDADSSFPSRRTKLNMLPINELTWPELARRYILAVLSMDGVLDSAEIIARESVKVFRCLQGDGGLLCGSLTGVAGMEADALLLAEASKKFFGSPSKENVLTIDDEGSDTSGACEKSVANDVILPEWAEVLEPVRKLPTNVGTRIRKCVYEALEKGPPEWAKEILEHSISKEVYKGNASGPTKKAVLSVLANVCSEGLLQKPEKRKKKNTVISVSDIIMKQCRIVLRNAAAADDAKVFCNLLGRKPINSSDNDDEGFLGSPGMMSRPLDFRTIDLRLAVGAYCGSHEAFLEDVRELWSIVRAAYSDQPDLVELAEILSQNFESMYGKEVVTLVEKFVEYAKFDSLSVEMKKEITGIAASTNEMPKAPWEEGVCKVCGIDKDDDSVLLCDTCDAEYHTYCLNPPLARIPEGNWYCPSCAGKRMVKDASERSRIIVLHRGKKYQGKVTRVYLESLARLGDVIEQKEYWEFTVEERTSLLKFLCDDLLCSSLLRQHLEQCVETSAELQQRLRSSSVEWRNLKSKEEILCARAAKDTSTFNFAREAGMKEGHVSPATNHVKSVGQTKISGDSSSHLTIVSDDMAPLESNKEGSGRDGTEKTSTCRSQMVDAEITEDHSEHRHVIVDGDVQDNTVAHMHADTGDQSRIRNESASSKSLLSEKDGSCRETPSQGKLEQGMGRPTQPRSEQGENCLQSGMMSNQVNTHVPPLMLNDSQAYQLELNSVRSDILLLEDSLTDVVSELLKSSVRREFLGIDSNGRMYWASTSLGGDPQVIVDGSSAIQRKRKHIGSVQWNSVLSGVDSYLSAEGSKAQCPYSNTAMPMDNCSPWGCYQTDTEIKELIRYFKDNDPKERELKDSILNWQKIRFSDSQQTSNKGLDHPSALSMSTYDENTTFSSFVTKAATLLEKKYGPYHYAETNDVDVFKKRGKKAKGKIGEKIYRCECLELIWPTRYHCSSCHISFSTNMELEGHSDCKSSSGSPAPKKGKDANGSIIGNGVLISEIVRDDCADEMGILKASKGGLIKFTDNELACPYSFDEIRSKFVTNSSNKELVQEIGLLSTNGVPSFIPSVSPCIDDSPFMYDISGTQLKPIGKQGFPPENGNIATTGHDCITHTSSILENNQQAFGCSGQRKFSLEHHQRMGFHRCSVVPQSSLRPLIGKISHISKWLKANLLDMDAALPEEALRPSKASPGRRCAWRAFVKSAETIYEMVQATIVLENMIRAEYLRNEWWYWSSLTAAAKTSTMSSLALRICSLDAAIIYEKTMQCPDPNDSMKPSSTEEGKPLHSPDPAEKTSRITRKSGKKRKEPE